MAKKYYGGAAGSKAPGRYGSGDAGGTFHVYVANSIDSACETLKIERARQRAVRGAAQKAAIKRAKEKKLGEIKPGTHRRNGITLPGSEQMRIKP